MNDPLVACLLASNRPAMFQDAMASFGAYDYRHAVLFIDDGPGTHGAKMDRLFRESFGEFCLVHDDDDAYAADRISKLIQPMLDDPKILCVGTSLAYYVDERVGKAWLYDNVRLRESWKANDGLFWLAAPMYRREAYAKYGPWEDIPCGADLRFLHKIPRERIVDIRDPNLMVCRIHGENAAKKETNGAAWKPVAIDELPGFYKCNLLGSGNERSRERQTIAGPLALSK